MDIHRNDLLKLALFYSVDIDEKDDDEELVFKIGVQLEEIEINDPVPTPFEEYNNSNLEEHERKKMLYFAEYYCIKNPHCMTNDEIQIEINKESDKVFYSDFYYLKYKRDGNPIDRNLWLYNRALKRMELEIQNFKTRELKKYKRMQTLGIGAPVKSILTHINKYKDISESARYCKTLNDIKKDYGLSRSEYFCNIYDKIIKY